MNTSHLQSESTDLPCVDLLAIGAGPFNLGLAALADPLADISMLVWEAKEQITWHPGSLIEGVTIQVPFLADVVSMADPTSSYSFLNFLKQRGRLYPFYIRESFYPLRAEYQEYLQWVAAQLPQVRTGHEVVKVEQASPSSPCPGGWLVTARTSAGQVQAYARHLAIGVGTAPWIPPQVADAPGMCVHSADYLPRRDELVAQGDVTVIGSGQSAAEIYRDLLERMAPAGGHVSWLTRSPRFFPMEYTKLTLEMTSPDYARHHRGLEEGVRADLQRTQRHLYKGINGELIDEIFDLLYRLRTEGEGQAPTTLCTNTEVLGISGEPNQITVSARHSQTGEEFELPTSAVVLATGYAPRQLAALEPIADLLRRDDRGRPTSNDSFRIDRLAADAAAGRVYILNGDEHIQSFISPDLGMGAYRNSVILADLLGYAPYAIEERIALQEFGVPERAHRRTPAPHTHETEVAAR